MITGMHQLRLLIIMAVMTNTLLPGQSIHSLAKEGDLRGIVEMLNKDTSLLDAVDDLGYTPLHWALIRAKWDLADYLADNGADINAAGSDGGTPLHCAANHENVAVIEMLLDRGARVDARNLWGNTPLALAAQRGCTSIAETLVRHGADINSCSAENWTPLHYAYKAGHKEMVRALLSLGASDTITDKYGKRPGEYIFERPAKHEIAPEILKDYPGSYYIAPNTFFRVTLEKGILYLEDVALDEIYPVAYDRFYNYREPWKIRFFRNTDGEIDIIAVDFQRQTVIGRKVKSENEVPYRPLVGIATRPLQPDDVSQKELVRLFFGLHAGAGSLIVTKIGENTPASLAGIEAGDIIVGAGNEDVTEPGDLIRMLYDAGTDSEIRLKIMRGEEVMYKVIKLSTK
jgi:hypothetical protein